MAVKDPIPRVRSRLPVLRQRESDPLFAFRDEFNRLFADFWRGFDGIGSELSLSSAYPRMDVTETDKELRVEAELPGLEDKDVEALLDHRVLTIRGERKLEQEEPQRLSERFHGGRNRKWRGLEAIQIQKE
jgi:HSP20 family protein